MKILWERHLDSLAEQSGFENDESEDDGYNAYKESVVSEFEQSEELKYNRKVYQGAYVSTPMGLMGTTKRTLASNKYSIWIGRTLDEITPTHLSVLGKCYGVEVLVPLTRYSFLMGTGPQFDNKKVRTLIESSLSENTPSSARNRIDILKYEATLNYSNWAIISCGDSQLELVGGTSSKEVETKVKKYGELWKVVDRSPTK